MHLLQRFAILMLLPLAMGGCTPDDAGPGATQPVVVRVELGDAGALVQETEDAAFSRAVFDISASLPAETPFAVELFINSNDLRLTSNGAPAETVDATAVLIFQFDRADAADPCTTGSPALDGFTIEFVDGEPVDISPPAEALDADSLSFVSSGQFGLCITLGAQPGVTLSVEAINLRFIPLGAVTFESCAEVLALAPVASAISLLETNSIGFALPAGSSAPDLEGAYALQQETTFDPDDTNVGDEQTGNITLANQTAATIRRSGFGADLDMFVQGTANEIAMCSVARTGVAACDQTIARLESLTLDAESGDWVGSFLSVAVVRHRGDSAACGAPGDFIFGTLTLSSGAAPGPNLVRQRGVVLPTDGFVPGLIALPGDGGAGAVADVESGAALQFATAAPFTATAIALPDGLDAQGFSGLGYSRDGQTLAVVTDSPATSVAYDNDTLELIRETAATSADYLGGLIDFSTDGSRIYVPTTDPQFADRITVLRTDDSPFADEVRRIFTPQGLVPVQARISPDGAQLATLIEGGAPVGLAAELTLFNADTGDRLTRLNLEDQAGGTVLASELHYSADGSLVFMAGLGAVVAVQSQTPFGVTLIDVSDGAADNPIALALSNDGDVLAVAVDAEIGDVEFAVIDLATLAVVNTQDLPGVEPRGAIGVAHFGTARVAMVANFESTVVAVQTTPPYTAGAPLTAATDDLVTLDRIVAGGDVIAVTNIDEPAIYLFEIAPSQ